VSRHTLHLPSPLRVVPGHTSAYVTYVDTRVETHTPPALTTAGRSRARAKLRTQFTCFTRTLVQILTPSTCCRFGAREKLLCDIPAPESVSIRTIVRVKHLRWFLGAREATVRYSRPRNATTTASSLLAYPQRRSHGSALGWSCMLLPTPSYVSIRQHTSVGAACCYLRPHTSAYVSIRRLELHVVTYALIRQKRQHTSAYVSIRRLELHVVSIRRLELHVVTYALIR
jgi:hypothetical protein